MFFLQPIILRSFKESMWFFLQYPIILYKKMLCMHFFNIHVGTYGKFTYKSSCLEPVAQLEPNFDKIVIGWSSSKIVSGSCALPPRWQPQCSCVVIESSFDPGERLQAHGSLWFEDEIFCVLFILYS